MPTTDLERLSVQLSADIKRFENEMRKARGVADKELAQIEKRAKQANKNIAASFSSRIGTGLKGQLVGPLAGITAALGTREIIEYADAWKRAQNALRVSGIPAEQLAGTLERLFGIAQGAGADLESTVTLFSRLSQSAKELGANQDQLYQFTTGVGNALKVAGTSAASASGALLQLSQALGGSIVRAEEFNSINEGARPILQAVANGLDRAGGSVSKLRNLVIAGEVSSKEFFNAFLKGSQGLAQQASQAATTFGQAFTKIENAFTKYIGQTDEGLGASKRLIAGLEALADNFDATADTAIAFASILAAGLLGRGIGKMISQIGLAGAALVSFAAKFRAAQAAARGGLLGAGLAAGAGPVGAAIGVAAAAALYFATSADEASEAGERYAQRLERIKKAAEEAAPAIEGAADKITEKARFERGLELEVGTKNIKELEDELNDLFDALTESSEISLLSPAQIAELEKLQEGLSNGTVTTQQAIDKLYEMAQADYAMENVAKQLAGILEQLQLNIDGTKELKKELGEIGQVQIGDERGQMDRSGEAFRAFTEKQMKDAQRTQEQRELDAKTKEVMKAAEDAGLQLTEAAARIQAASIIAADNLSKASEASVGSASELIKEFEGFREKPYWDVNAMRAGYGSDTVTLADGTIQRITAGMRVSVTDANRDLARRIGEFQAGIESKIGAGTFRAMNESQQAALTSIAYNYGSLPNRIVEAIRTGNVETISNAIRNLGSDNAGVNRTRRAREADIFESGAPEHIRADIQLRREQADTIKQTMDAIRLQNEQLGLETGLISASNAERERQMLVFETINQLQAQGITVTDEMRAAIEAEAAARYQQVAAYDAAALAAERLKEQQEALKAAQAEISGAFQGALKGLITDLVHGKDATEALYNAVSKLADRLLDIALDLMFSSIFGGLGGGGGILGALFRKNGGIIRRAEGGVIRGPGGPRDDRIPVMASNGEFIVNAAATRQHRQLLETINSGRGFASGGVVLPTGITRASSSRAPTVQAAAPVDQRVSVINRFDAAGVLSEAMSQPEGVKIILNVVRAQPAAFRQAIQG